MLAFYIFWVFIFRYIALTFSMHKNILFADKFNFLQNNLFGQDVIFHFNLVASQVFECNFSQLNWYRIDKFPLHYNHRQSLDGWRRQRGQWTRANNNQPLRVEGGRTAACRKSSGQQKRGKTMPTRRTRDEEEDYDSNEDEDCVAALTRCQSWSKTINCSYNSNILSFRNNKCVIFPVFKYF